jgi:hypothetical protein
MGRKITAYVHPPQPADPRADNKPGFYYVTVRRCNNNAGIGAQYRRLRGPFVNDHAAALAAVPAARIRACECDPRGVFYAYGTARSEVDLGPGLFDKLDADAAHATAGRGSKPPTACSG